MILAGDIGGTNTRLAFFALEDGRLKSVVEQTYPSRGHATLEEIVADFRDRNRLEVRQACFGIAGPVRFGRVRATNLPWMVDSSELARALKLARVELINDLEANAYGLAALGPHDFAVLREGANEAIGNAAIIAAGTGLGEAGLYWDGERHQPFACEGGHADFAPANELQIDLLNYLIARYQRVSWERVLSGPGLVNIYSFLRDTGRGEEPRWLAEALSADNPAAVISAAAIDGRSQLCMQALDLFCTFYGAEAGNLALKMMALGGIFLGGGIAPKIMPKLRGPAFINAFVAKGRLRPLLEDIPVRVVLNDRAALLGAARCASLRASRPGR
jgi:glucokinase